MKRIINGLLTILMMLSFTACSKNVNIEEKSEGFRSIVVADFTGNVGVTRNEGDKLDAYRGLSLFNGDDVKVAELSDLTLDVDSDKHLYAEEKTHFWLEATGEEGNSKTRIHLAEGSVLCRVEKALTADEIFEVVTDTSTMSVRGTVFGITIIKAEDGTVFEVVRVYDGKVATKIEGTESFVAIEPGQCAVIKEAQEGTDEKDAFVVAEALTDEFWENPSGDVETIKEGENPIIEIDYTVLSSTYIEQLIEMAEDGEELVINTEKLQEIKEIVVEKEEQKNTEEATNQEETKVEEKKTETVKEDTVEENNTSDGNTSGGATTGGEGGDDESNQGNNPTENTYSLVEVCLDSSGLYSFRLTDTSTAKITADVLVKIEGAADENGNKLTYDEKARVELSMDVSSGSIGTGSLTSSTSIIDTIKSDVNSYLGGGGFNSADRNTLYQFIQNNITTTYVGDGSSIKATDCRWNSNGTCSSVTLTMTVTCTVRDYQGYSSYNESEQTINCSASAMEDGTYVFSFSFADSKYDTLVGINNFIDQLSSIANSYIRNNPQNLGGNGTNSGDDGDGDANFGFSMSPNPEKVTCEVRFNTNKNNIQTPGSKVVTVGEVFGTLETLPECVNEDGRRETFTCWYDKNGSVVNEDTVLTQDLYNSIYDTNAGCITLHAGWTGQN